MRNIILHCDSKYYTLYQWMKWKNNARHHSTLWLKILYSVSVNEVEKQCETSLYTMTQNIILCVSQWSGETKLSITLQCNSKYHNLCPWSGKTIEINVNIIHPLICNQQRDHFLKDGVRSAPAERAKRAEGAHNARPFCGLSNAFTCCGVISQPTVGDWLWQLKQAALDSANRHTLTLDILCTVLFKRQVFVGRPKLRRRITSQLVYPAL
jgi:hypothetical protein